MAEKNMQSITSFGILADFSQAALGISHDIQFNILSLILPDCINKPSFI
ncbi:hypothetical protein [Legionella israelensis]|nr:hypothetical protein [Legionella israelensis]